VIECASVRPPATDRETDRLVDLLTAARLRLQRIERTGMTGEQRSRLDDLGRCLEEMVAVVVPTEMLATP